MGTTTRNRRRRGGVSAAIAGLAIAATAAAAGSATAATPAAAGARTADNGASGSDGVRTWQRAQGARLDAQRRELVAQAKARAGAPIAAPSARRGVAAAAAAGTDGYVPLAPDRILDTRSGNGAPKSRLGAGGTVSVQVSGRPGIPATGVAAVVVNLTAVTPSASTYLSAYPTGGPRPATSNVSVPKGVTTATSAVVALGTGGKVTIFNAAGTLDVLADVSGYFVTGGEYHAVTPTRLLDTRSGVGAAKGAVGAGRAVSVTVAGKAGIPATGVAAVVGTVTVVAPTAGTYAVAYPAGQPRPGASTVNAPAKRTVANSTIVKLGTGGAVTLYNAAGSAHLLFDVAGYLSTGGTYVAITPTRVADTRSEDFENTPLGTGEQESFPVTWVGGEDAAELPSVPSANVSAVVVNLTAVLPQTSTYLGAGPSVAPITTSTLNAAGGTTTANLAVVKVGAGGMIDVLNARGDTHVIIDIVGYFTSTRTPTLAVGETLTVSVTRDQLDVALGLGVGGVSEDGRYVLFDSADSRIVPGGEDKGGVRSTYLRDTALGWTVDVWGSAAGPTEGTGISSDGRTVTFDTAPLVGPSETVVHRPTTGAYDYGSVTPAGAAGEGRYSAVSANGEWIVYAQGTSLLRRRLTEATATVVGALCSTEVDCERLAVSDDGRYVTYIKELSAGGRAVPQVFQRDVTDGTTTLVSSSATGTAGDAPSYLMNASDDGSQVLLSSYAGNLVAGDELEGSDVFVKNARTGAVTLVSATPSGVPGNGSSGQAQISADGTTVAFISSANNLLTTPTAGAVDRVYVRDLDAGATRLVSSQAPCWDPVISATGAWVAYTTSPRAGTPTTGVYLTRVK